MCPRLGGADRGHLFFFDELTGRARALLRHVHTLARTYHWTEPDVFSLPHRRRLQYLALLEEEQDALLLAGARGSAW